MKILLFGANGQVGTECALAFREMGYEVIALTRKEADFCQPDDIYNIVKTIAPSIVVNACAYTAVDKAETEPGTAKLVNSDSVGSLAKACAELNIVTLHISTDYVYNGKSLSPYREDDPVAPLGVYGQTKLDGETKVIVANPQHIILRTSWVYSAQGNNFVKTMLRLGSERTELGVVNDQFGCPTYAADIAKVLCELIVKIKQDPKFDAWGVYHCCNSGKSSWYDFAVAIFKVGLDSKILSKAPQVNGIPTEQYPTPAKRPEYTVLDCTKLERLLGYQMPHWQHGLFKVCKQLR